MFGANLLERAEGFEPSTPTLARLCSTPELRPQPENLNTGTHPTAQAQLVSSAD